MDSDGTKVTVLSAKDIRYGNVHPAWSPDGKRIAWTDEFANGKLQVFVPDADGRNAKQVTNESTCNTHAAWSPDGAKIAFIRSNDNKTGRYIVMDPDGGNQRLLLSTEALLDGGRLAWRPKGLGK